MTVVSEVGFHRYKFVLVSHGSGLWDLTVTWVIQPAFSKLPEDLFVSDDQSYQTQGGDGIIIAGVGRTKYETDCFF